MTLLDFQLIIVITVTIQVAVLNWFSLNSHSWCGSTHRRILLFLETISLIEPLIWGKCTPKTGLLPLIRHVWGFLRDELQNCILYPISHRNGYIHFCCPTPRFLKNGRAPKKFFAVILENIVFFKKIVEWKIFKTSFPTKKFILIFAAGHPLSLKMVMASHKWFSAIFST